MAVKNCSTATQKISCEKILHMHFEYSYCILSNTVALFLKAVMNWLQRRSGGRNELSFVLHFGQLLFYD